MIRISRMTDYATVILAALARSPVPQMTAAAVAARTRIAPPTVSKLLKQLHRAGLVASTRGLRGGYQLARRADSISAAAILDALEGPLALTECASSPGQCDIEGHCRVSRAWQSVSGAIRRSLQDVTLAQLAGLENEPVHLPILEREVKIIGTRTRGAS
ncbi:MAG: HTH-type transcriptional regulator IscR [Steroidobacteraceae bacterium]|nr:HTH-type transcriptional regulator IscR [Steroidobacteraceae bacterium]